MFYKCSLLEKLNFSNFNTDNLTDMSYMFCECYSLKEINLKNFDTENVYNINHMFNGCSDEFKNKLKSQFNNIKDESFK